MMELAVIHTNDTHGRMKPPVSDRLRALRERRPGSILLDAGDAVSAGNLGFRVGGEPVLETMSELGYAAMCMGNRESHPLKEIFPKKIDRARFPVLSANASAKGDAPLPLRPHVVLEWEGRRIVVFGLTVPMFTKKQWSQPLCDYWFDDPLKAARKQVDELRSGADLLIALTHVGFRQDLVLAAQCPEIDLIIGGHSHTDLAEPHWVGSVPVLQARAFGCCAGVATVSFERGKARLTSWERVPLRDDIPA